MKKELNDQGRVFQMGVAATGEGQCNERYSGNTVLHGKLATFLKHNLYIKPYICNQRTPKGPK